MNQNYSVGGWNPLNYGYGYETSETSTSASAFNNPFENSGNGLSNAYDNAVLNTALEFKTERRSSNSRGNEEPPKRSRSPVQKVLRYRLDDPQLTSVNDSRYRPYDNGRNNQKTHFQSPKPYFPRNRPLQRHNPETESSARETDCLNDNGKPSAKEREFADRCLSLGVTFNSYKQKKTVEGVLQENIAIEVMNYNN